MKRYVIEEDGLILDVINESQLDTLKQIDTKGLKVYEVSGIFSNYLNSIHHGVFRLTYNFLSCEVSKEKIPFGDIRISNLGTFFMNEDYTKLIYEDVNIDMELFNKVIAGIESEDTMIEELLESNSVDIFSKSISIPDNHPERTKKSKEKSDKMLEFLISQLKG